MTDLRKELERLVEELRLIKHKDEQWLRNCNHGPDWFSGKTEGRIEAITIVLARLESILRLTAPGD